MNHFDFIEAFGQVPHAPVNFAQLFLAVDVLGVFGSVTLGRGRRYCWNDFLPT